MTDPVRITDLVVEYPYRGGFLGMGGGRVRAVDGVSFAIGPGETLGLVGESGSGKTSVGRAILGIAPITAGAVRVMGLDVASLAGHERGQLRRHAQMVFQQPTASLDPRMRIGSTISEPLVHLLGMRGKALAARVAELLVLVGLEPGYAARLPRQLSGGQRQRVAIARAIATSPAVVVCDEPTSSLDVSVQAQIINLLTRLQSELGLSYLFISHDLATVRQIADSIAVMHNSRIVEQGTAEAVLASPRDEYTRALIAAVPSIDRIVTRGPVPTAVQAGSG